MSSPAVTSKVSFTVRRPTPISRHGSSGIDSDHEGVFKVPSLPRHLSENGRSSPASPLVNGTLKARPTAKVDYKADSSDEEEQDVDEMITGFDEFGVERCVVFSICLRSDSQLTAVPATVDGFSFLSFNSTGEAKDKEGPLVIAALPNRDWREIARKRKAAEMFLPGGGAVKTGADGSVGGLGTTDAINSGPQLSGLVSKEKKVKIEMDEDDAQQVEAVSSQNIIETEDERAIRALIASARGDQNSDSEFTIGPIYSGENDWSKPADETDAYRRDVATRPNEATLEDYERIPVEQFGAALLRGMGWKPGQAASRTRVGPADPYLPASRPALLGIGAKEREVFDDGSRARKSMRPDKRYIPVVKKEREGSNQHSGASSRRSSRSPGPDRRDRERRREKTRETEKERGKDLNRYREQDSSRGSDRGRHYDDRDRRRRDRDNDYESSRDRDYRRDEDKDRRRDYDGHREKGGNRGADKRH